MKGRVYSQLFFLVALLVEKWVRLENLISKILEGAHAVCG